MTLSQSACKTLQGESCETITHSMGVVEMKAFFNPKSFSDDPIRVISEHLDGVRFTNYWVEPSEWMKRRQLFKIPRL